MRLEGFREERGVPFLVFPQRRYCQLDPWPSPPPPCHPHAPGGIVLTQQIVPTHVSKYLLKLSLITKQAAMLTGWRAEDVFQSTDDGEGAGRRGWLTPKINRRSGDGCRKGQSEVVRRLERVRRRDDNVA